MDQAVAPGEDEVEDVVWIGEEKAILFSVKSTLMAENEGFNISSDSGVVEWFERFLFAPRGKTPTKTLRGGAARLLDSRVEAIRAGKTPITATATIFPVVVMYDDPLENVGVIDWFAQRQRELGVLTQPGVKPLLVCSIETFEAIMFSRGTAATLVFSSNRNRASRGAVFDSMCFSITSARRNTSASLTSRSASRGFPTSDGEAEERGADP